MAMVMAIWWEAEPEKTERREARECEAGGPSPPCCVAITFHID